MNSNPLFGSGLFLVAVAYAVWSALAWPGSPLLFGSLVLEAVAFAALGLVVWSLNRDSWLLPTGGVVLAATEVSFFFSFLVPDALFVTMNALGIVAALVVAVGAFVARSSGSWRVFSAGLLMFVALLVVSVIGDIVTGSTILLTGYLFAVPGWALVVIGVFRADALRSGPRVSASAV